MVLVFSIQCGITMPDDKRVHLFEFNEVQSILCFAFVFFCATDMVCCGVPLRGMTSGCICCFKVGFNLSSLFVVLC